MADSGWPSSGAVCRRSFTLRIFGRAAEDRLKFEAFGLVERNHNDDSVAGSRFAMNGTEKETVPEPCIESDIRHRLWLDTFPLP